MINHQNIELIEIEWFFSGYIVNSLHNHPPKTVHIMSKHQTVIDSYLRCVESEDFFDQFYDYFLSADPEVDRMFRFVNFSKQKELIRKGLMSMLTFLDSGNIAGKVTFRRLRDTHGSKGMNVQGHHYELWKTCLMRTIADTDPEFDEELRLMWDAVLDKGILFMQEEQGDFVRTR
ncbi:MAG: hypothetical protein CMB89_15990 [Flammeovirgaceae bacterium]|nr:hypothetical protein [Flammeovirgaceae bacterium]